MSKEVFIDGNKTIIHTDYYLKLLGLEIENKRLKEKNKELELQNFNLKEDIMIKKISIPSKEIKDKSFYELYDIQTYEELKEKNLKLNKSLIKYNDLYLKEFRKNQNAIECINQMIFTGYRDGTIMYMATTEYSEFGVRAKLILELLEGEKSDNNNIRINGIN